MNPEMTHERCSELLSAYARHDLGDADERSVTSHLQSCTECQSELSGLTALFETAGEGLTEGERRDLHSGIRAALRTSGPPAAQVFSMDDRRERRWGVRAFQALGAAAALALVVVAAGYLFSGQVQQADQAADGGSGGGQAAEGTSALPGPSPRFANDANTNFEHEVAGLDEERSALKKHDLALFALKNLDLSRKSYLTRLGRNPLLSRFVRAYDASDAEEFRPAFVDALASGAGGARREVANCTEQILDASTGPIVPVFGSFTTFGNNDAVVVGFIYTDKESGPLDRYTIWVWRRGSCDTPLETAFGAVR